MNADEIEELVAEYLERREAGEALSVDDFVAAHPGVSAELREALMDLETVDGLFPDPSQDLPETLGPYRVVGELGRGASGKVLRVVDPRSDGAPLALKLLGLAATLNPRARERFQREARALQELAHPNIVRVRDAEPDGSAPYLVMDLVEGQGLETWIEERRDQRPDEDSVREAVTVVLGLARGVAAVHERGLLHRDLKPANVVLRESGEPVLVDFGLVGVDEEQTLTETGDVLGTPHYMAPEQARGRRADSRADVYGLGCILFAMLTRQRPRSGPSVMAALEEARTRPLPRIRSLERSLSRDLESVVFRATAFDPARRTATVTALIQDLEAYLEGRPVGARPPGLVERAGLFARERPALATGAGIVALIGVALVVGMSFGSQRPADRSPPAETTPRLGAEQLDQGITAATEHWLDGRDDQAMAALDALEAVETGLPSVRALRSVLRRDPLPSVGDVTWDSILAGQRAILETRWGDATQHWETAARTRPDLGLPVSQLGFIAERQDDFQRVVQHMTVATRLLPGSGRAAWRLGYAYRELGQYEDAVPWYEKALELLGSRADLHKDLAVVLMETGQHERALDEARIAVEIVQARDESMVVDSVLRVYGVLLDQGKQHKKAEPLLREVLRRRPGSSRAHVNLGINLDWQHRLYEAEEEYLTALDLKPDNHKAMAALAWLYTGSDLKCQKCRAYFEENPDLLDTEQALEYCFLIAEEGRGDDSRNLMTAALVAGRIGEGPALRELLLELLIEEQDPDRILNLQRTARFIGE